MSIITTLYLGFMFGFRFFRQMPRRTCLRHSLSSCTRDTWWLFHLRDSSASTSSILKASGTEVQVTYSARGFSPVPREKKSTAIAQYSPIFHFRNISAIFKKLNFQFFNFQFEYLYPIQKNSWFQFKIIYILL